MAPRKIPSWKRPRASNQPYLTFPPPSPQSTSIFMTLPAEVRHKIYLEVFDDVNFSITPRGKRVKHLRQRRDRRARTTIICMDITRSHFIDLLLTCRAIYVEAKPVEISNITLHYCLSSTRSIMEQFVPWSIRDNIKSLHLWAPLRYNVPVPRGFNSLRRIVLQRWLDTTFAFQPFTAVQAMTPFHTWPVTEQEKLCCFSKWMFEREVNNLRVKVAKVLRRDIEIVVALEAFWHRKKLVLETWNWTQMAMDPVSDIQDFQWQPVSLTKVLRKSSPR